MQDVFLFPSPGLERRRIRAQIATFSPWKPSTSLLSTTLSTETCYASVKPRHASPLSQTNGFPFSHRYGRRETSGRSWLDCCTRDQVHEHISQTEKLAFFTQQGRADIYNIDVGSSTALMVVNLYRWQGAANNTNSKKKTDELIEAARQEVDTTGIGPKIILGDINTDIDSSPAMRKLITQRGWTDVASLPAPINNHRCQPTCTEH